MHQIAYIVHKDIDFDLWDATVDKAPNAVVYAYSWYLNAMCDNQWDALVLGDYEAVFPLPWRKKWGISYIYQPFFCQQLGLFGQTDSMITQDLFLNKIPKRFKKIHLQLNGYFLTEKYARKRTNHILPLNKTYEELRYGFKQDAIKNLKKLNGSEIHFIESSSPEYILHAHRKAWGALNESVTPKDYDRFLKVCQQAYRLNKLITLSAKSGDTILGSAIFMRSPNRLHYLISAPEPAGRKYSIMHGIIDHAIQSHAGTDIILDFEGSEIAEVATFYEKWGASTEQYYLVLQRRWL